MKTIKLTKRGARHLGAVKKERAQDLNLEDCHILRNWANWQFAELTENLTIQEVLNCYRASADWDTFQDWFEHDVKAACKAWNRCVLPKNKRSPL